MSAARIVRPGYTQIDCPDAGVHSSRELTERWCEHTHTVFWSLSRENVEHVAVSVMSTMATPGANIEAVDELDELRAICGGGGEVFFYTNRQWRRSMQLARAHASMSLRTSFESMTVGWPLRSSAKAPVCPPCGREKPLCDAAASRLSSSRLS